MRSTHNLQKIWKLKRFILITMENLSTYPFNPQIHLTNTQPKI